jgi:hypothetical protein
MTSRDRRAPTAPPALPAGRAPHAPERRLVVDEPALKERHDLLVEVIIVTISTIGGNPTALTQRSEPRLLNSVSSRAVA